MSINRPEGCLVAGNTFEKEGPDKQISID